MGLSPRRRAPDGARSSGHLAPGTNFRRCGAVSIGVAFRNRVALRERSTRAGRYRKASAPDGSSRATRRSGSIVSSKTTHCVPRYSLYSTTAQYVRRGCTSTPALGAMHGDCVGSRLGTVFVLSRFEEGRVSHSCLTGASRMMSFVERSVTVMRSAPSGPRWSYRGTTSVHS